MNLLTKFHKDRSINVVSRVKNAPPLGSHTNLLTVFHEDWTINVASREKCPASGGHVFKETKTIFELIQDIIGTNLLTKFHKDRKINVASRVLTRIYYSHIRKNALPPGGHVFQPTCIIFKLVQDIIGMNLLTNHVFQANTNLLTKFHEDWTINANVDGARRTTDKRRSQKFTMSTLCSGVVLSGGIMWAGGHFFDDI
ncbi:hypothetical protein DPMN_105549 [Dreissena polymorpha]|uniref:Uncharacterized protein n=1 Tax=Dreissena polymorpha TaxID=45954 RepID=A0A9D4K3E0_DREPO|nr:hypothetical protein DPMN_105549 [Dreissena polymorpha]